MLPIRRKDRPVRRFLNWFTDGLPEEAAGSKSQPSIGVSNEAAQKTSPNPPPNGGGGQYPQWWKRSGEVINITSPQDWYQKCEFIKGATATDNTLVVVEFRAPWCGPSSFIAPFIKKQAEDNKQVLFVRLNYDKLEEVAAKEGVAVVPTFLLFKNGKKVAEPIVGAKRRELFTQINKHKT